MNRQQTIEYIQILEEAQKRRDSRNEIYENFRNFKGRYAVLIGGSGSGKSYAVADKVVDRIVQEDDHRILAVRAEGKQVTKSQFPLLVSRIKKRYNKDDFIINYSQGNEKIVYKPNGNEILFSGLDDVDKLKSIFDITSVWIEEADQTKEKDLRELDRRLRGYNGKNKNGTDKYMQIVISFNPVSILSWLKKRFFDKREDNQIMLHGKQPFTACEDYKSFTMPDYTEKIKRYDKKLDKEIEVYKYNTLVCHSTYLDNKFVGGEYHVQMMTLKEESEEEFNIYALGMWGITGGTYFDKGNVNARILLNIKPLKRGYFEFEYIDHKIIEDTIIWVEDENGYIELIEDVQEGYPYVGGGDTAGDGSDWNTAVFTNNVTEEDVAAMRINFDEDLYARQMYCLGRYYNWALLAIETNFSTHPQKELERLGYPNLYIREQSPDAYTNQLTNKYGFNTNKATRPTALGMLRTIVREEPHKIKITQLLHEMTVFVKNEKGKPEAMKGEHDDMIMARAINCYCANQQTKYIKREHKEPQNPIYQHKKKLLKQNKRRKRCYG